MKYFLKAISRNLKIAGLLFFIFTFKISYSQICSTTCNFSQGSFSYCGPGTSTYYCDCECQNNYNLYTWYINGTQVAQTNYPSYQPSVFNAAATIQVFATSTSNGDIEASTPERQITIKLPPASPGISIVKGGDSYNAPQVFTLCNDYPVDIRLAGSPDVNTTYTVTSNTGLSAPLSISQPYNPASDFVRMIASKPNGQEEIRFTITATKNGCNSSSERGVGFDVTGFTITDVAFEYRRSYIRRSGNGVQTAHYWQTFLGGESTSNPLSNDYAYPRGFEITTPATYSIRKYNSSLACWTDPSPQYYAAINYSPPPPNVTQTQFSGYVDVSLGFSAPLGQDTPEQYKTWVLQYADYYIFDDPNTTVADPLRKIADGHRIFTPGIYYIRGVDRGENVWGSARMIEVKLKNDFAYNWIHTRSFDGGQSNSTVVTESKSYFDQNGKALQSQSKNITSAEVFATQNIRDEYDRVVGSTLPAPIGSYTFNYNTALMLTTDGDPFKTSDLGASNSLDETYYGTLGWYYSTKNTLEPLTPVTDLPYNRSTFYNDGSGEAKLASGVGEALSIGSNHEILSGTFPVFNELDNYLSYRSLAVPGISTPNQSLANEAAQTVTRDQTFICTFLKIKMSA